MAEKQPVLIAARELRGGHRTDPKDPTTLREHVTPAGHIVDGAEMKKLGINSEEADRLLLRGDLVEEPVYVTSDGDQQGHGIPGTTGTQFEGLSADAMRQTLDDAKVKYPKDASPADLMKIALEHHAAPTSNATATGGSTAPAR